MRKVINRTMYDTAKAEKVAEWNNGHFPSDFRAMTETLYKTPSGKFFVAGWGGAMTKYRTLSANSASEGSDIIPLSGSKAFDWLAEKGFPDKIIELFPDEIKEA